MSIRTILTPFTKDSDTPSVRMALALAKELEAHVDGIYVEPPQRSVPVTAHVPAMSAVGVGGYGAAVTTSRGPATPDPVAEATRVRDQWASAAKSHFEQLCHKHEVRFLDTDQPDRRGAHPLPCASYRREAGSMEQVISQHAHAYDMMVTESAAVAPEAKPARAAIDTALLQSGRPVLLAPIHPPENLDGRVLVAWNGSPQCWHALSTALPFMTKAKEVVLFHAGKDGWTERQEEERAADYLAWHGIKAEVVQHEPGEVGVADYLMSQCNERQVGLMVMGAYSHSPLRERLLGGVTLSMLTRSAATPVLMVH
ncbi:MAG: universal stress protein [Kiloniellales bacterium]